MLTVADNIGTTTLSGSLADLPCTSSSPSSESWSRTCCMPSAESYFKSSTAATPSSRYDCEVTGLYSCALIGSLYTPPGSQVQLRHLPASSPCYAASTHPCTYMLQAGQRRHMLPIQPGHSGPPAGSSSSGQEVCMLAQLVSPVEDACLPEGSFSSPIWPLGSLACSAASDSCMGSSACLSSA